MLTRFRGFLVRHQHLIGYLILVAGLCVALAVGFRALQDSKDRAVKTNRASAVTACAAYNKVVRGVNLLVDGQVRQTSTSRQRTAAEKAAAIAYLDGIRKLFPKLDCTADPIRFDS